MSSLCLPYVISKLSLCCVYVKLCQTKLMSSLCRLYVVYMSSLSLKRTTRLKLSHHMLANCWYISPSIVVMIPACHSGGRSSSPCWESNLCWKYWVTLHIVTRMAERSKALLLSRMLRKWPGFDSRMIQLNFDTFIKFFGHDFQIFWHIFQVFDTFFKFFGHIYQAGTL